MRFRLTLAALATIAVALLPVTNSRSASTPPRYTVSDLGTLGGEESDARAINQAGTVVGAAATGAVDGAGKPVMHAYRWEMSGILDLGTLGGPNSAANALNDRGDVVGTSDVIPTGYPDEQAFTWNPLAGMQPLSGESLEASCVNNRGLIGGAAWYGTDSAPCIWYRGRQHFLNRGLSSETPQFVHAINDRGEAVGLYPNESLTPLFIWWEISIREPAQVSYTTHTVPSGDRGTGFGGGSAYAINRNGDVVGIYGSPFVWRAGRKRRLPEYSLKTSRPAAINDTGVIVGSADGYGDDSIALLWVAGQVLDLNALLVNRDGWQLQLATGINNRGQIVGTGLHNGVRRGFLLTPQ